jgi:hypothetical protein
MRAQSRQNVKLAAMAAAARSLGQSPSAERRMGIDASDRGRQISCHVCKLANLTLYRVGSAYACAGHRNAPLTEVIDGGSIAIEHTSETMEKAA